MVNAPIQQISNPSQISWGAKTLLLIFIIFATVFSAIPIHNQLRKMRQGQDGTKDYPLWYATGNLERHGQSPYYKDRNNEFPFMYPPGAAGILAPLTTFGVMPLVVLLVLLNTAAWLTCIFGPIFLVAGRVRGLPLIMYWAPSLVCIFYIWDTYLEGQLAFCLSACLVGMLVCVRMRKGWTAGFLLALAAGFKAFPILALPYLIYRRQWKAIASTAIFLFIFLFALPACFRGTTGAIDDLKVWKTGMLSPNTPEKIGQRAARSYTWQNGSLLAVAHRWLRPVIADHDDNVPPMTINVANLKFETINHIATGVSLLICLGYVAVMPRDRYRTRLTDAAEGAMLLILIILFCPLSFTYNNSWLMCGITVLLYYITSASKSDEQSGKAVVWLAIALLPLIFSVSTSNPHWRYIRAMGNTFIADIILLIELGWLTSVSRRRSNDFDENQGILGSSNRGGV